MSPNSAIASSATRRSYEDWSDRLLERYFRTSRATVEELDVTDASIAAAGAGDASGLLRAVRQKIRDIGEQKLLGQWKFSAQLGRSDFFAFLFATCRVEWERETGTFERELETVLKLGRATEWIDALPELWQGLVKHLERKRRTDPTWSELRLPRHYANFRRIGTSVGLVFPRRTDRTRLRAMFADYREHEPPLATVIGSLRGTTGTLSEECRAEANWFIEHAMDSSDERALRFRRVLSRTLEDALHDLAEGPAEEASVDLCLWLDEDGYAQPQLLLADGAELPEGFYIPPEERGVEGFERVLDRPEGGSMSAAVALLRDADDVSYELASDALRTALGRGHVPLARVRSLHGDDWYAPALGRRGAESIEGYLVRIGNSSTSVGSAHRRVFSVPGAEWVVDFSASLAASDTGGPRLRVAGPRIDVSGLRDGSSRYLCTANVRPRVRCDDAASVRLLDAAGQEIDLVRAFDGLWDLPSMARGTSTLMAKSREGERLADRRIELVGQASSTVASRWPEVRTAYWKPAPSPEAGATKAETKLGWFLGSEPTFEPDLPDTDAWQSTGLWLGPRVGDVSAHAKPGFDWRIAESTDQRRRVLTYDGDPCRPTKPMPEFVNSDKAACRLWRTAFDPTRTRCLDGAHQDLFDSYARLRDPGRVRQLLGRLPDAFPGPAPPLRTKTSERSGAVPSELVSELEFALTLRASDRSTPLPWPVVRAHFDCVLRNRPDGESIDVRDILRAWQETGALDVVGVAWHGTVVVPRKPRFLLYRRGRTMAAALVGLANESLRASVSRLLDSRWTVREKRSVSPYVPPILEACGDDAAVAPEEIRRVTKELGLASAETLRWPDTSVMLPGLSDSVAASARFDRTEAHLPVASPTWTARVGDSSIEIRKIRPRGQAPVWVVGPHAGCFAICTSPDWAWRLAMSIAAGETEYFYAAGAFRRDVDLLRRYDAGLRRSGSLTIFSHLPLDAGRLLSVLSNVLPGPVADNGYEYAVPTDFTGSVVAERLNIRRRRS